MGWGKVDDQLHSHPKWRRATKGGRALWVTALSWCSSMPSGGFVPKDMLRYLDGTSSDAASLVNVGLWDVLPDGYVFHEWSERNPDADTVKAVQGAKSEGGKHGNHTRWHVKRGVHVASCEWCESDMRSHSESQRGESHANPPDPTRPDPIPTQEQKKTLRAATAAAEPASFADFWEVYPKRADKGHARTAYIKALKKTSAETLILGAKKYAHTVAGTEAKFIANASTWLNGERWEDEASAPTTRSAPIIDQWRYR